MKYTPEQLKEAYEKSSKLFDYLEPIYGEENAGKICKHDMFIKIGYFKEDLESLKSLAYKIALFNGFKLLKGGEL